VHRSSDTRGQATVELVALLPALAIVALLCAQLVVAGHAWTLAGGAARAGARAAEVGAPATAAATGALPAGHASRARVAVVDDGRRVRVRLAVPRLLPFLPATTVAAEARIAGGVR
jgi:hypothetical protein